MNSSKPGTPAGKDSPATVTPKLSKKERDKAAKVNQTDEALRAQANETANLALAGLGGGKKKYSWMTSGASTPVSGLRAGAGQRNRLAEKATGNKSGSTTPALPKEDPALTSSKKFQQLGTFKESAGLELRDIVGVLERDGKAKKSLLRSYTKLGTEK